ncbi:Hypothetical predicted protein [Mytilus galloprovincialis]|uniref:Uncharacterized protein n=1 Tax=Mytilus galloprovincialis TaxID=29158 RepID=A0A8B6FJD4_MYTGA|nr:Hypothetical predicted protein [Mytilus galloprovincialis]
MSFATELEHLKVLPKAQRLCNKLDLLMELASGQGVHMNGAVECSGKSVNALVMRHCKAPSGSKWHKGIHIKNNCSSFGNYVPAAQWINGDLQSIASVVVSCSSTVIGMISQVCGGHISLTSPLLDTLFVAFDSSCVSKVGTGLIWSIDAVCDSNATTIDDCFPGQTTWDTSVTDHTHDVYVRCKEKVITTRKPTTTVTTKATTSGSTTETTKATTSGSTTETTKATTSGSTTEETTSGSTTEESTSGSTTEESTSGSTTEETTSGSTTEESTSGSTTEESTSVSTTEETKTSTESMLYPSTTEYCLTNCNVIHTVTETVTMTQNITVTATATVNITITTSGK